MVVRSVLYIIAVILILGWVFGFFLWHAGHLIHILALLAVASVLLALSRRQDIG